MEKEQAPLQPMVACSPLLPHEIADVVQPAGKPLSRKHVRQLENQRASKSPNKQSDPPGGVHMIASASSIADLCHLAPTSQQGQRAVDVATLSEDRLVGSVAGQRATASSHREEAQGFCDQLNLLITWYSLVAKPLSRKMWATMPDAQAAVDAEWRKLRDADGGRVTG